MRTLTTGETVFAGIKRRRTLLKVEVQDGDGDFQDLAATGGKDWILSANWGVDVDADTGSATVTAKRNVYALSLAPTVAGVPNLSTSGDPLLQLSRIVKIHTANAPEDASDSAATDYEVFTGTISDIDWGGDPLTFSCRDLAGRIQDRWVEDSTEYGDSVDGLETVMQSILDDWGPGSMAAAITASFTYANDGGAGYSTIARASGSFATEGFLAGTDVRITGTTSNNLTARIRKVEALTLTLEGTPLTDEGPVSSSVRGGVVLFSATGTAATPFAGGDSPGWVLEPWNQEKESVMSVLSKLADQIAYSVRYRWNASLGQFALTLYEPDRASTSSLFSIDADLIRNVSKCGVKEPRIRNVVEVRYYARTADAGGGNSLTPGVQTYTDSASVAKYGRRWMQIAEGESSQIDTATEALAMATGCCKDLAEPDADVVVDYTYFWATQLGDLYTFPANATHFDTATKLAVVGVRHELAKGSGKTTWTLRGKPSTGFRRWYSRATVPGAGQPAVDDLGPATPDAPGVAAFGGGVLVSTTFPHNRDFQEFEFHVSTSSGFTPSSSTIFFRGRQRLAVFSRLHPDDTYYFKIVAVDVHGNRSAASAQSSSAPLPWRPAHFDPEMRFPGGGLLQGSFDKITTPRTFLDSPPDGWSMVTGTWVTDADTAINTLTGSAALELSATAVGTKIRTAGYIPVIADEFYRINVPAYASSIAAGNTMTLKVEWYTRAKAPVSTTTIYSAVLAAATTWENIGDVIQAPATATYARISIEKAATSFVLTLDRVDWGEGHPSFHVTKDSTTALSATPTAWTAIQFNDETATGNYDRGGVYDSATNYRFDAPSAGLYSFSAAIAADTCDSWLQIALFKNGAIWKAVGSDTSLQQTSIDASGDVALLSVSVDSVLLASGDYVEVMARGVHNAGAVTLNAGASFSGHRSDLF